MVLAKEQIRQMITENNIRKVGDIYSFLKDSFKDVLQEMLEDEIDVSLEYSKNQKPPQDNDNKRNGYITKTVKSQYGAFLLEIPGAEMVNLNLKSY